MSEAARVAAAPDATRRLGMAIAIAAWLAGTITFVEPLQAAMLNWDELSSGWIQLFSALLPVSFGIFSGALILVGLCSWIAPMRGPALGIALCVLLWLQGDLLVWSYGTFDGSPLDWNADAGGRWLEGLLWLGLPGLALWHAEWIAKRGGRILAAIVLLQSVGLLGTLAENAPYPERDASPSEATGALQDFATFALDRNVLVVVLDMVQSDLFAEAMRSDDLAARMPPGFVYYRDAISLYIMTQFSAQSMLTGLAVPDGVDGATWRDRAMKGSLPPLLAARGFDSRLASFGPAILACGQPIPGLRCTHLAELAEDGVDATGSAADRDANRLFRLGVFRLLPHALKRRAYDAGEWGIPEIHPSSSTSSLPDGLFERTRVDLMTLTNLSARLRAEHAEPRFRFLHLHGVHYPANVAADCHGPDSSGSPRGRAVETTRCMLRSLYSFFDAMEEAGAYDPSLILVVADHGYPWLGIASELADPPLPRGDAAASGDLDDHWRGVPLFLMKLPGARHALQTSDRPVSLCDIPATVFDVLEIEPPSEFPCNSVLEPIRRRSRIHYRYPTHEEQKARPRRDRFRYQFERYEVDGHSWNANSWRRPAEN